MSRKRKIFYSRLAEASAAAIALGITTAVEYQAKRNLDPKLPSCPQRVYKTEWQCWPSFLGKEVKQLYPSIAEASKAAVRLGCKTVTEYEVKRYLDPRLPSNPELMYKEEWQSWPSFFSKEPKQFYSTLAEFFAAVIELGVSTSKEYQKNGIWILNYLQDHRTCTKRNGKVGRRCGVKMLNDHILSYQELPQRQ